MKSGSLVNNKADTSDVTCPVCGSASHDLTTRGYSALFGYLGANRLYYKCLNCGHKWKAKSRKK